MIKNLNDTSQKDFNFGNILSKEELDMLFSGSNENIKKYNEILEAYDKVCNNKNNNKEREINSFYDIEHPKEIKEILDKKIIGQEEAKKIISQSVFNHIRLFVNEIGISEQHLMLIGPSGCGKTEIFRTLKDYLNLNVHILDMTKLSFAGYKSCGGTYLTDLLKNVRNGDIVVFDEFDKILLKNSDVRKDGYMLQSEFLKLFEADNLKYRYCLFVFIGAFSELFLNKESEVINHNSLGFITTNINEKKSNNYLISEEDLINHGVNNELLGRITFCVQLDSLDSNSYLNILKSEKGIYSRYRDLFMTNYNIDVEISDDVLLSLANKCFKSKLGVRKLNSYVSKYFDYILYNSDINNTYRKIVIDKDTEEFY